MGRPASATYSAPDPDNDQVIWSLSGDDAGDFSISNTGELTFQTAPDHEAPADDNTDNRYELTVDASDGSVKGTLDVTVTVTDVNEPPEFSVETASRTIAENTTTGVAIGDPVTATDSDTGDTPAYTLGGTDANFFDIDASAGQLRTQAALDYETKSSYTVAVTASDGTLTATVDETVTVTNMNEAPAFSSTGNGDRNVAENASPGQNIGAPLSATDPDTGDVLTYSLGVTDAGSFDIDASSGQLRTKAGLDYEVKNTYQISVSVRGRQECRGESRCGGRCHNHGDHHSHQRGRIREGKPEFATAPGWYGADHHSH